MHTYEAPSITKLGTVADLTQGNQLQRGHDSVNWQYGPFTGNGGGSSNGGGQGGGGFGS
jgi:hypothetical protein